MRENPQNIADDLVEQHGIANAQILVRDTIMAALASGDNYSLSIWREVRSLLLARQHSAENAG